MTETPPEGAPKFDKAKPAREDKSGEGDAPSRSEPDRDISPSSASAPEGLYRLLVESVRDYAIFALDPAGHVLTWSAGAAGLKGYARTEIIGRHFSTFYPPEDAAAGKPERELEEAARTGRLEDEGWRVRKDGSRFLASVVITALRDEMGALVGFAKVTRDVTERRRDEQALRESEERFRLLVESVTDYAIFMLDPEGHVATWNAGAERIKGYRAEEIIGRHFSAFYPEDKVATSFPQFELEVAAREGRFEDEGWRVRKDGSRFWANVVITALRDPAHRLVGFAKVTRDLTHRRAAEEQARRLAAEEAARAEAERRGEQLARLGEQLQIQAVELALQTEAAQSLAEELELANEDLQRALADANDARAAAERLRETAEQARREAQVASRAKSEFLATMSHELRTPLNAIAGYAQLIDIGLRGPVTSAQREDLDRIRRSQLHLMGLINEVLNYTRLETGAVTYDLRPTLIADVVAAATPLVEPQRVAKRLTIDVHLPEHHGRPPLRVLADGDKLQQILLNLLSNALKFTPEGGRVTIEVPAEAHERGMAVLRVADTGIGIAADKLEAVFEPFVQVGRSLNSPSEGTGLGLAISRDLARGMHGDLTAQSTPGAGSTFVLTLPLA